MAFGADPNHSGGQIARPGKVNSAEGLSVGRGSRQ